MNLLRTLSLLLFALLATLPLFGKAEKEEISVLFIGNSYTYVNDLPGILESLAQAEGRKLHVESYTQGAATLMEFMSSPAHARCRELVSGGRFHYVILQDQSQTPWMMPERTLEYGRQWCELARKAGAKPVLFITWAHAQPDKQGRFEALPGMQEGLTTTYCQLAVETRAMVAPVGEAWKRWHRKYPDIPLHSRDGSHPNALGSYLAANVIYATIFHQSPIGLSTRLKAGGRPLRLPAAKAKDAQKIAAATLKHFSAAKYLEARAKADAALPRLEELMPLLQQGATMAPLTEKLGKPASRQAGALSYPLRGGAMLHLTPGENGKVRQAIVTESNGTPRAVLLQP